MMYKFNGRKMNEGINLFYSIPRKISKYKFVIFLLNMQGSIGYGDKEQRVVPKIVGSIPLYPRTALFFMQYIAGKFRKC
jgi:hypothetical protein